jgi:hypothetical protein
LLCIKRILGTRKKHRKDAEAVALVGPDERELELFELPLAEGMRADAQRTRPRVDERVGELTLPASASRQVPDVQKRPQAVTSQLLSDPFDDRPVETVMRQKDIELRAGDDATVGIRGLPQVVAGDQLLISGRTLPMLRHAQLNPTRP